MDSNRLWSPAFTNYGISSGILYMTQYVLVAALPIVITSELSGSDLDAGLAMTYFQIGTILCRIFAGRLIDGLNKRIVLLISTALFFIIMGLFNFTTSLEAVFRTTWVTWCCVCPWNNCNGYSSSISITS